MRDAAVGFQCPDCVREGAKTQRAARTTFGGLAHANDAVVTKAIAAVCIAVYIVQLARQQHVDGGTIDRVALQFGMISGGPGAFHKGIADGEWYRLITPMFLHASVIHIVFNMLALLSFGSLVERLLGRWRFLALYFVAGISGNVASYLLGSQYSVGASTALFGLFGAYFVLAKRMRADTSQVVGLIAVNLVITFAVPFIDWHGHIGGLIGGAAVAAAMAYAPRSHRTLVQAGGTAAVLAIAIVLAVVRTAQLS